MGRSKLLIAPELLAELLSLPMGVEIIGAEMKVDLSNLLHLAFVIDGDRVPESKDGYVTAEYELIQQKVTRFIRFQT